MLMPMPKAPVGLWSNSKDFRSLTKAPVILRDDEGVRALELDHR